MAAYTPLTVEDAIEFTRKVPGFFSPETGLECEEIGDGNLNLVFRISSSAEHKSLIIKQALPYAKVVGESWPLSLDRARIEREALIIQHTLCPDLVPAVYGGDPDLAITVMEDLSDHVIMRKGLIEGQTYPKFAEHIGRFIATTLFFTSDLGMNQQRKKELAASFTNPDLCKITEDLIFSDPYRNAENNDISADIRTEAEKLWTDEQLHLEVALLREKFLTHGEALIHGDLHTGSIFVTETSTKVIDPEFAYYGPIGFDLGAVIANLVLNFAAQPGWKRDRTAQDKQRAWLLDTIREVWVHFERHFSRLWEERGEDPIFRLPAYREHYVRKVLQDAIGFAGCKVVRRIVGLSHVADIETIAEDHLRHQAKVTALAIGKALIKNGRQATSIEDALTIAKNAAEAEGAIV
ncbi:S-methyl-5-thioribose kinase [Paenibacillus sanfengchensis]|uniref:S-methyl-5-thioribose kinase n=1 Tax=Paenibacillus sanfengchensis TaxID=3119819 RepID=UPI002FE374DF